MKHKMVDVLLIRYQNVLAVHSILALLHEMFKSIKSWLNIYVVVWICRFYRDDESAWLPPSHLHGEL